MARPRHKHRRMDSAPGKTEPDRGDRRSNIIRMMRVPFVLLVLVAVYYWPILTARGFFWNDFPEQNFPYRLFAARSIKEGVFPFWNPYVFSGMPFFADVQAAVLYPLNLLLTPFVSGDWLSPLLVEYQIVLHILLAGLFMFWLCRDFGITRTGSTLGGMTFMFCAVLTAHIFHVNMIHTAVWFPLIVLLMRRALDRQSLFWAALCALALANTFLAGYPQLILHIHYWLGAFVVFGVAWRLKTHQSRPAAEVRRFGLFLAVVALGAGLSAIQLLPTNELGKNSERPTLEFRESCEGSFRPYRFVTLVAPNFFGTPDKAYWGIAQSDVRAGVHTYWETAIYCGIIPLLLAILSAVFIRTPPVWFLSGMALLSLLLAMGDSFFLYWIVFKLFPLFDRFRVPGRFAYLFSFSVAVLSGFGLDWLLGHAWKENARIRRALIRTGIGIAATAVLIGVIIGMGGLRGGITNFISSAGAYGNNTAAIQRFVAETIYPQVVSSWWVFVFLAAAAACILILRARGFLRASHTGALCIAVTFVDLLLFLYGSDFPFSTTSYVSRGKDPGRIYAKTPVVRQLTEQLEEEFFRINSRDSRPGTTDLGGRNMIFEKNQGSVHELFLMEGYNPLRLKRQLLSRSAKGLDILNVKYTIHVDHAAGRMGFALNENYLPRARVVYDYRVVPEEDRILSTMWREDFDHVNSIVLEQEPGLPPSGAHDAAAGAARIIEYGLNAMTIEVTTPRDGFLVLSEIHYPCWKAVVDGRPTPLHRADYALRAVEVPEGTHTVRCYYESRAFQTGARISLVCLLALAVILVAAARRNRQHRSAPA
ncbi:MAG: YfhO family protein [Chitinivibrionales bacterium]|nr:YfhO family protein [Chitinivibrionales bacterium]MBD3397250.1 YfhO family protein [Chitinivibrionales bacterium]